MLLPPPFFYIMVICLWYPCVFICSPKISNVYIISLVQEGKIDPPTPRTSSLALGSSSSSSKSLSPENSLSLCWLYIFCTTSLGMTVKSCRTAWMELNPVFWSKNERRSNCLNRVMTMAPIPAYLSLLVNGFEHGTEDTNPTKVSIWGTYMSRYVLLLYVWIQSYDDMISYHFLDHRVNYHFPSSDMISHIHTYDNWPTSLNDSLIYSGWTLELSSFIISTRKSVIWSYHFWIMGQHIRLICVYMVHVPRRKRVCYLTTLLPSSLSSLIGRPCSIANIRSCYFTPLT